MPELDRDCCVTLDELQISPAVEYDRASGSLIGEVTLKEHSGKATHGLVFMLAGQFKPL